MKKYEKKFQLSKFVTCYDFSILNKCERIVSKK